MILTKQERRRLNQLSMRSEHRGGQQFGSSTTDKVGHSSQEPKVHPEMAPNSMGISRNGASRTDKKRAPAPITEEPEDFDLL